MTAKSKTLILKKSIALAALWIFCFTDASFALRPVAFDDRPSSGSSEPELTQEENRLLKSLESAMREKGTQDPDIKAARSAYLRLRPKLQSVKIYGFTTDQLLQTVLRAVRNTFLAKNVNPAGLFDQIAAQDLSGIRAPQEFVESLRFTSDTLSMRRPPAAAAPRAGKDKVVITEEDAKLIPVEPAVKRIIIQHPAIQVILRAGLNGEIPLERLPQAIQDSIVRNRIVDSIGPHPIGPDIINNMAGWLTELVSIKIAERAAVAPQIESAANPFETLRTLLSNTNSDRHVIMNEEGKPELIHRNVNLSVGDGIWKVTSALRDEKGLSRESSALFQLKDEVDPETGEIVKRKGITLFVQVNRAFGEAKIFPMKVELPCDPLKVVEGFVMDRHGRVHAVINEDDLNSIKDACKKAAYDKERLDLRYLGIGFVSREEAINIAVTPVPGLSVPTGLLYGYKADLFAPPSAPATTALLGAI